jgi:hypothetical protein
MSKTRTFDCVDMKREIQARMAAEYAGLTPDAARLRRRQEIEDDPAMARFVRHIRSRPARQLKADP